MSFFGSILIIYLSKSRVLGRDSKVNKKSKVLKSSKVPMIISAGILAGTGVYLSHHFGGVGGQ